MDLRVWSYPRRSYIFKISSISVQGFGAPWSRNLAVPITLGIGFYNSYRTSRDTVGLLTFPQGDAASIAFNCCKKNSQLETACKDDIGCIP